MHYIINSRLKGSAECIKFLLGDDCKADINMADSHGYTALHKAAYSRKVKRVNQLIKSDANLCARTNGEDGTFKKGKSAINFIMKYSPQSVKAIEQVFTNSNPFFWYRDTPNGDIVPEAMNKANCGP